MSLRKYISTKYYLDFTILSEIQQQSKRHLAVSEDINSENVIFSDFLQIQGCIYATTSRIFIHKSPYYFKIFQIINVNLCNFKILRFKVLNSTILEVKCQKKSQNFTTVLD